MRGTTPSRQVMIQTGSPLLSGAASEPGPGGYLADACSRGAARIRKGRKHCDRTLPAGPATVPPPAWLCRLPSHCSAAATLACLQWLPGRSWQSSSVKGQMVDMFGGVVSGCSPTGTAATCVPRNPLVLGKQGRLVTPLCRPSGLCCSCSAVPLKCCSSWKREETEGAWLWAHKTSFMKSSGQAEGFAAPCSEAAVSLPPQGLRTCMSCSSLRYAPMPLLSCPLLRAHGSQAPGC